MPKSVIKIEIHERWFYWSIVVVTEEDVYEYPINPKCSVQKLAGPVKDASYQGSTFYTIDNAGQLSPSPSYPSKDTSPISRFKAVTSNSRGNCVAISESGKEILYKFNLSFEKYVFDAPVVECSIDFPSMIFLLEDGTVYQLTAPQLAPGRRALHVIPSFCRQLHFSDDEKVLKISISHSVTAILTESFLHINSCGNTLHLPQHPEPIIDIVLARKAIDPICYACDTKGCITSYEIALYPLLSVQSVPAGRIEKVTHMAPAYESDAIGLLTYNGQLLFKGRGDSNFKTIHHNIFHPYWYPIEETFSDPDFREQSNVRGVETFVGCLLWTFVPGFFRSADDMRCDVLSFFPDDPGIVKAIFNPDPSIFTKVQRGVKGFLKSVIGYSSELASHMFSEHSDADDLDTTEVTPILPTGAMIVTNEAPTPQDVEDAAGTVFEHHVTAETFFNSLQPDNHPPAFAMHLPGHHVGIGITNEADGSLHFTVVDTLNDATASVQAVSAAFPEVHVTGIAINTQNPSDPICGALAASVVQHFFDGGTIEDFHGTPIAGSMAQGSYPACSNFGFTAL